MSRSDFESCLPEYRKWKRSNMAMTEIEIMICEFPDRDWDWKSLSYNSSVSFEMYLKFPDKDWCWIGLSAKATGKFLVDRPDLPWVWDVVAAHVEIGFIDVHPNIPWNYWVISRRNDLSEDFIIKNIDLPWDWVVLSENISLDFIGKVRGMLDMCHVSARKDITPEFVGLHPDWGWDISCLAKNVKFPISWFTDKNYIPTETVLIEWQEREKSIRTFRQAMSDPAEFFWEFSKYNTEDNSKEFMRMVDMGEVTREDFWFWFSASKYISLDFILRHINKPWFWTRLSQNPIVTEKFVMDNPDLPWDWVELWVANPNTGHDFAIKYKDRIGNSLFSSDKITLDFLKRFPVENIFFNLLSWNKCLTAEIYRYYSDQRWDYIGLSMISCLDSSDYLFENFLKDCAKRRGCIVGVLWAHPVMYPLRNLVADYVDWE